MYKSTEAYGMIGMKNIFRLICRIVFFSTILVFSLSTTQMGLVKASAPCASLSGNNAESQDYAVHAEPSGSALASLSDGRLMSVTRSADGDVVIMYFNSSYEHTATRRITPELPIYGGFFASSDGYYYLATGQDNPDESNDVEVYRITKYDSNWNEVSHTSLHGANTVSPYHAGSCDFAESDRYLFIHTCHTMYKHWDGLNHQANATIQIDKNTMTVVKSYLNISDNLGYVSHSFNQFIRYDSEDYTIAVDHGDGHPRSVTIFSNPIDDAYSVRWNNYDTHKNVYNIPGSIGDNYTGVSVGGFEYSDSAYLIAINTVDFSGADYDFMSTRNIVVISVPKYDIGKMETPILHTLTNYSQGDVGVSTPRLVKIGANSFLVLWSRNGMVYYSKLDGNGNPGSTYSFNGSLSDCSPVIYNGYVVWYVYNEGDTYFYRISTADISNYNVVHVITDHDYVYQETNNGDVTMVCSKCGDVFNKTTASSITVFGCLSTEPGYYSNRFETTLNMDQEMHFEYWFSPVDAEDKTLEVIVDNENIMVYNPAGQNLTPLAPGKVTVTFRLKYNPTVQRVYTFTVTPDFDQFVAPAGCVFQYRLYNPNSGEHFYTGSQEESINLIKAGWNFEGSGFITPTEGTPIYRLYSAEHGDHFYTTNVAEKDALVAEGWTLDGGTGIAFPSADASTGRPMYQVHNPNAYPNGEAGAHHFTMSWEEVQNLVAIGWEYEGIAWYSV